MYWPLEIALHTDVNYIQVAYSGHVKELNALFGASDNPNPKAGPPKGADGKVIKLTPNIFDLQFDGPRKKRRK